MRLRSLPARAWHRTLDAGNAVHVPRTGRRLGLGDLVRRTLDGTSRNNTMSFARSIAFSWLLAIFPLTVLAISTLGLFHASGMLLTAIEQARDAMPTDAYRLLTDTIVPRLTSGEQDARLGIGAAISAAIALWGVSGAMREVMTALNVMYGVRETRGRLRTYLLSIVLAIGATMLVVTAALLLVGGPRIAAFISSHTTLGAGFEQAWSIVRWPVLALLVLTAFALVYRHAPNVERRLRLVSLGSIAAFLGWLGFTWLFGLYVNTFGSYSRTYGALAGVVVLMLYLAYSSFIVLLGAQVDRVIEEHRYHDDTRKFEKQT